MNINNLHSSAILRDRSSEHATIIAIKAHFKTQYINEAKQGRGFTEDQINAIFDDCFEQFIATLKREHPSSSIATLAEENANKLRELIEQALPSPVTTAHDQLVSLLQEIVQTNRETQEELRKEIADTRDKLADLLIEQGLPMPPIASSPQRNMPLVRATPSPRTPFDPNKIEHLEMRIQSQQRHIAKREQELEQLENEVRENSGNPTDSSDEEWLPPMEVDSEGLTHQNEDLLQRHQIFITEDNCLMYCRGCTRDEATERLHFALSLPNIKKLDIMVDSLVVKSQLQERVRNNYSTHWITVIPKAGDKIMLFRRHPLNPNSVQ